MGGWRKVGVNRLVKFIFSVTIDENMECTLALYKLLSHLTCWLQSLLSVMDSPHIREQWVCFGSVIAYSLTGLRCWKFFGMVVS